MCNLMEAEKCFKGLFIAEIISLLSNNSSLQEFQSTCRQEITWTVVSTDAAITNVHFVSTITNNAGNFERQKLCILLRLNVGKKKARSTETIFYRVFKLSLLKITNVICFIFFPKYSIMLSFSLTCDVLFGGLGYLLLFDCICFKPI